MKRQIRRSVFETNSSSMHSLSITSGVIEPNHMSVNDEDKIEVELGEFGWGYDCYTDQLNKLSYLMTMCTGTCGATTEEGFYESESFKKIEDAIREYCGCSGIEIVNANFHTDEWSGGKYLDYDGYIDHQSMYNSVDDFLADYNTDIIEFVFNPNVKLIIDNDNH